MDPSTLLEVPAFAALPPTELCHHTRTTLLHTDICGGRGGVLVFSAVQPRIAASRGAPRRARGARCSHSPHATCLI